MHNIQIVSLQQLIFPLGFAVLLTLILFGVLKYFIKDDLKVSLALSVFLIIFWNYDLFFKVLNNLFKLKHWHTVPLLLFFYGHIFYFINLFSKKISLKNINKVITLAITFLIIINLIAIIPAEIKKNKIAFSEVKNNLLAKYNNDYPDIYLIILDEYARFDTIKEEWGYDNSDFANFLKNNGFFIAEKSEGKHDSTIKAMPDLLNIQYLNNKSDAELASYYYNSYLLNYFNNKGYYLVFLDGFDRSNVIKPNYINTYISYTDIYKEKSILFFDSFSMLILSRTILYPFNFWLNFDRNDALYYDGNKYFFNYLKNYAPKEKPKFVFAHIMCPHLPYVFNREGNLTKNKIHWWQYEDYSNEQLKKMYLEQYIYVTTEIKNILESIKRNAKNDIIIIQSDHGPRVASAGVSAAQKVLNAIYFPDQDYKDLNCTISPINTLRIMLNQYFGENFNMLEDN